MFQFVNKLNCFASWFTKDLKKHKCFYLSFQLNPFLVVVMILQGHNSLNLIHHFLQFWGLSTNPKNLFS